MRRVLISLGMVGLVALTLIIATPFIQARRLSKQLMVDAAALRAREIPRVPPVERPLHDNGFRCLHDLVESSPVSLAAFRFLPKGTDPMPWVRGEQPIETLPPDVAEQLGHVVPWVEQLRSCGSSRMLQIVEGVEPWNGFVEENKVFPPLVRATVLQMRQLLAAGRAEEALTLCESTFETVFDLTHINLISTLFVTSLGRELLAPCASALSEVPIDVRAKNAPRWKALNARFVDTAELLEVERLNMAATVFLPLTNAPQLSSESPWSFYDGDSAFPVRWWTHHAALRVWSAWDARMRALANGDFSSSRTLPGVFTPLLPTDLQQLSDYEPYLRRIGDFQKDVDVLVWIADGAHAAPPVGARVDGGVELPTDGGVRFLPVAQE